MHCAKQSFALFPILLSLAKISQGFWQALLIVIARITNTPLPAPHHRSEEKGETTVRTEGRQG